MRNQLIRFTRYVATLLAMIVILGGCKSDNADFYVPDNTIDPNGFVDVSSVGYLSLSGLSLAVSLEESESSYDGSGSDYDVVSTAATRTEANYDDYIVTIYNSAGEVVYQESYATAMSSSEALELPADYYTIIVSSHSEIPETGDYPCYASPGGDADTYAVGDDKEVGVTNEVTCRLANLKTSVNLSADLLSKFKPAEEVDTDAGEVHLTATMSYGNAAIDFVNDSEKSEIGSKVSYFAKNSETSEMTVKLSGMYNTAPADEEPSYTAISWSETVSDVDSGQAREVSIKIDNYNDGKLLCKFDVESWIEEETLGVDVQSSVAMMYVVGEDVITDPDSEKTDSFSPETIIKIGGEEFDLSEEYAFDSSIFDEDLQTYSNPIIAYVSPYGSTSVANVSLRISSDNESLMNDIKTIANSDGDVSLWSDGVANSDVSQYMTVRNDSGTIKVTMLYAGMVMLQQYKGIHTIKVIATGSNNMKSYTTFMVNVISELSIEWCEGSDGTIYDFATRYPVYTETDVLSGKGVNPEVAISIESAAGITGLTVAISSPVLTESELAKLSLTPVMDLINPETAKMAETLSDLGFPVGDEVDGEKSILFDISTFMPMLALLSSPDYLSGDSINTEFTITVTDTTGTQECAIMVCHTQP